MMTLRSLLTVKIVKKYLNADLLLEGGPYGCYDDYIVEILGKGGNVLNGDDVGKSYTVKVTDPETGNFCTTDVSVVDNIPPTLTGCIDVTVSCNDDITPNAPISGTLLVGEGVMGPVPETGTAGMASFDLNVSLPPVDILDVDIYMQVDHTWVSDLSASLTSPNGTSVTLFTTNTTCTSDNMDVTFDDEAANTHAQFEAQCNANPAKEGEFQPQQALSAFDGSANGQSGDWVLDFNDTTGGDSGNLNEVELRIEFAGSFPAPTAFDACGDVSLTFQDEETNFGACDDITKIITRTWTAVDESGNVSTCAQQISVTKASFADVGVPPNYDDQDQPSLACDDQANWDQDGDGLPDPAVTGGPTGTCDNINFTYEDVVIPICEGSFKVLRKWTLIDWCVANGGGDAVLEYNQIIKVSDKEGPSVVCPPDANVNANSNCQGAYILPDAQVNDNCSGTTTIAIFDEDGNEYAPGDVVMGLELGTYVFTYVATDDCGNESDGCTHIVTVEDNTPPVPICDEQTSVSLGSDGEATVCAETFDDGSYDNCEVLAYKVKRADDPSFVQFTDCVTFDCSDVGQTIMVRLRVYDIVGNNVFTENDPDARFNECTVEVTVDDQLDPVIVCPPNKIIDCGEFDPAIFDGVSPNGSIPVFLLPANEQIGFYSNAFDNCGVTQINVSQNGGPDQCGEGTVTRIYTAVDADGQTASCVQIITITNSTPFNITDTNCFNANPNDGVKWPCDISLTTCGAGLDPDDLETNPGVNPADVRPIINEDVCDLVGVSFDDTPLPIQPPGCISLVRKWTVVDWCQPDNSFPLGYVTWTYNQEITVFESLPPTISGCDDVTVFGFSDNCEPFATGDLLTVQGDDDCTPVDDLVYTYKIDAFFDPAEPGSPTYDFTSDNNPLANPGNADNSADGSYPIGTHLIQWAVEDGCGNLTTCQYTFTVVDATPPTPICKNLTVSLVPTGGTGSGAGTATVFAAGFENGDSYDNCTAYGDLVFSFEPFDYFNGTPVTERMYDCDDLGPALPVEIYVYDEYGNFDFCETFVLVKDPLGVCNVANQFDVTGAIETENNDPVAKVDVTLNNNTTGIPQMITTDNSGLFNFSVPANNNVQVEPAKDINYTNGVTTFDLVQITKHVLSLDLLDSPYKIIAADASNDGVVSTYDVVLLRKLILNIDQELEFNDSWRFVDASYVFPNQNNPFNPPFPEVVNINDIAQDELFNDFVGVKIGDVTGDAKANEFVSGDDRNFTGELVFAIDDAQVAAGEVYTVDFKAADFNNILGYQFTMNFDNNAFDLVNIEAGNLSGLTESNFGLTNVADGVITTSWNAENVRVADDEVLFSITFKAKQTAQLSNALSVNSSVTKAEAYTANLGFYTVALRFDTENGSTVAGGEFELYQNEPNPFKSTTVIGFNLPKAAAATLTIYDVSGKVVKSYEGDFAKGYNNIVVERSELGATGVLYYELSTDEFTATKKMITIE
jgi:subtilisin-like proprotein convertase family protein